MVDQRWYAVPDAKDGTTVRVIATSGFTPKPNYGTPPRMTNGQVVPEQALITQTVNGVTVTVVDTVQLILIFGVLLAAQLWPF